MTFFGKTLAVAFFDINDKANKIEENYNLLKSETIEENMLQEIREGYTVCKNKKLYGNKWRYESTAWVVWRGEWLFSFIQKIIELFTKSRTQETDILVSNAYE